MTEVVFGDSVKGSMRAAQSCGNGAVIELCKLSRRVRIPMKQFYVKVTTYMDFRHAPSKPAYTADAPTGTKTHPPG